MVFGLGVTEVSSVTSFTLLWRGAEGTEKDVISHSQDCKLFFQIGLGHIMCLPWAEAGGGVWYQPRMHACKNEALFPSTVYSSLKISTFCSKGHHTKGLQMLADPQLSPAGSSCLKPPACPVCSRNHLRRS